MNGQQQMDNDEWTMTTNGQQKQTDNHNKWTMTMGQ